MRDHCHLESLNKELFIFFSSIENWTQPYKDFFYKVFHNFNKAINFCSSGRIDNLIDIFGYKVSTLNCLSYFKNNNKQ